MTRRTAIKVTERKGFGGSFYDSVAHAAMFRDENPYDFGVKTAMLYSAQVDSDIVNKKFTYHTYASGNYYVIPGGKDEYTWSVIGDGDVDFVVTELLVAADSQPGKNGVEFEIALNNDWLHEPVMLLTEDPDVPGLLIKGHPRPLGNQSWAYTVVPQTGDTNKYIPVSLLQPGKIMTRVSAPTSDEENPHYAPDQYSSMMKLRSIVGQVSNKIEFSDKFIRMEVKGKNTGETYNFDGRKYSDAFTTQYIYQTDLKDPSSNNIVKKNMFISAAEARLLERCEMDRELLMEFGQTQYTYASDTEKPLKIAPGWREIRKDGHYFEHNGSLTLKQLYEYIHSIYFRRQNFKNRKIKIYSGEGGIAFLSEMIKREASTFQTIEPGVYIQDRGEGKYHSNEKTYGAQFTKILFPMGVEVEILYDPIKDNDQLFKRKAPGSKLPLESFTMDIFDFGHTDNAPVGARSENITMVMQDGVEEYYQVGGVYDIRTGAPIDGSVRPTNSKRVGIYRTCAGSLAIFDVSRVGCITWRVS